MRGRGWVGGWVKVKMRVNVRRWEMHRDGEGIAVVPSYSLNTFLFRGLEKSILDPAELLGLK